MKRAIISFISICLVVVPVFGCNISEQQPQIQSTIGGIRETYYDEGIRYLNFYTSDDYIIRNYNSLKDLSVDESSIKHKENISSIRSVMNEYKSRADGETELIFAEKLYDILESAPMVSVFMVFRDMDSMEGAVPIISGRINEFYSAVDNIKKAKSLNDINRIDFETMVDEDF